MPKAYVTLTVIELTTADVFQDMARVHLKHRQGIPAGSLFRLSHGTCSAMLVARGARANRRGCIAIDLKTRNKLGIGAYNEPVELTLAKANIFDALIWGWHASEPIARIAVRLGVLSLVLGALGLGFGVWSVVLTLNQS